MTSAERRCLLSFRVLLAASAVILAVAAAGPASASVPSPQAGPPPLHTLNLRSVFERALPGSATGQIAGVVPTTQTAIASRATGLIRGRSAAAGSAASKCNEPDCNLSYGGGPVQHSPHVYLLLWGPGWSSTSAAASYLGSFYSGLGTSPDDTWSTVTSQYGDTTGKPAFGSSVYVGTYEDTATPPNPVTPDDLAAEADAFATQQKITDLADAQIVVASQSGTCFSDGFAGSCGSPSSSNNAYCAWHSITLDAGVPYTNLPYLPDAGADCGTDWINAGSAGTYDGFSIVGGHEYAETITDPDPVTGWYDPSDATISGGEVADKCAWGGAIFGLTDPQGDITLSSGTFAMQSLWSNAARRCVMTSKPTISVTAPPAQQSTLGAGVSLQVSASSNTYTTLSFSTSGLPDGVYINKSTGHIAGTPGTTAGTWHPTVTITDYAGAAHVSFTWQVASKPGAVKGFASKCADDYGDHSANGTKIDLWTCDGQARQRITFAASGELQVAGKCITAKNGSAVLETCAGSAAQTWTRRGNGEYVVSSGGHCLADPGSSRTNGTQLRLQACADSSDQRWSLP